MLVLQQQAALSRLVRQLLQLASERARVADTDALLEAQLAHGSIERRAYLLQIFQEDRPLLIVSVSSELQQAMVCHDLDHLLDGVQLLTARYLLLQLIVLLDQIVDLKESVSQISQRFLLLLLKALPQQQV